MRPIAEATSRIAGKSFSRKHVALGRILDQWEHIIGRDLSAKAQPVKLRYYKKEKQEKSHASLDIAVSSADATLLHYQQDLILERINQIFGDRWITALRFVNKPANSQTTIPKKQKTPLTAVEKNTLSGMLKTIADTDIQERLGRLGEAIMITNKHKG